ncbi:MAG TPA: aldo/keto reductase [Burkholderiales bacterium]|nr:aldo/keto reductase [Burkholderiales bacterium]
MQYKTFGRTGLEVSQIVFGGGWVGGVLIHQDDDTKLKTLRRAIDAGINWIDTAPSYGKGRSEQALGWLLKEIDSTPHVSTKFMLDTAALDDIPGQVERSLHESLARLNLESVDLLQLHNPIEPTVKGNAITPDLALREGGVADALERMREQGLTKFVGITALGEAASLREAIDSGRFDSAQVYYNLLNPSAGRAMPARWTGHDFGNLLAVCKAHDMGTMAIRVFAAGVLATDVRHGREVIITRDTDVATEERRAHAVFAALGDAHGTRQQTALRFVLGNPDLSCAVIGLAELAHLEEALVGAANGPLPKAAMEQLEALYAGNFGL